MNPSFSLSVHSLICPIIHSFLNGFQPILCHHFSHICSIYLSYYIFSVRSKYLNILRKAIALQTDSCYNLDPSTNNLHKLLDTQSISMYHSVLS